jgi:Na+/H+ antiporter NhaD/arsenite permease-like protein
MLGMMIIVSILRQTGAFAGAAEALAATVAGASG